MTNEEIYDFIGELAIALYSKKIQISLGALRAREPSCLIKARIM